MGCLTFLETLLLISIHSLLQYFFLFSPTFLFMLSFSSFASLFPSSSIFFFFFVVSSQISATSVNNEYIYISFLLWKYVHHFADESQPIVRSPIVGENREGKGKTSIDLWDLRTFKHVYHFADESQPIVRSPIVGENREERGKHR